MALVGYFNIKLHKMDMKTTFLNDDIDEMIYMLQLKDIMLRDLKNMIYKLNHGIWLQNFIKDCIQQMVLIDHSSYFVTISQQCYITTLRTLTPTRQF